jgi:hypothetical protein
MNIQPSLSEGFLFYVVFIIMNEIALQKVLDSLLVRKFPDVKKINVEKTKWGNYDIRIGLPPALMDKDNQDNIRKYVKDLSKFVMTPEDEERLFVSFFYSRY